MLTSCQQSKTFDLRWDEEVAIQEGRTIVANLLYTYERIGHAFWPGDYDPSIVRSTKLSFDAGAKLGRFTQVFDKHRVGMIEFFNGGWYLLLHTRGGALVEKTDSGWAEQWGPIQTPAGHKCWRLDARGLTPASINDLPAQLLNINLQMDYAPAKER